jgi:hypothetical protein
MIASEDSDAALSADHAVSILRLCCSVIFDFVVCLVEVVFFKILDIGSFCIGFRSRRIKIGNFGNS